MLAIAAALAAASAWLGYAAAVWLDANVAGTMAVVTGLFYASAVLAAPRYGVVPRLARELRGQRRIVADDLLAMLYRLEELAVARSLGPAEAVRALGGGFMPRWALWSEAARGRIERSAGALALTAAGRQRAGGLVRSHRLWEAWLVENLGLPLDHVHAPAERMEHYIGDRLQEAIQANLGPVTTDPHGREIPQAPST
jgi:hypothetical protein